MNWKNLSLVCALILSACGASNPGPGPTPNGGNDPTATTTSNNGTNGGTMQAAASPDLPAGMANMTPFEYKDSIMFPQGWFWAGEQIVGRVTDDPNVPFAFHWSGASKPPVWKFSCSGKLCFAGCGQDSPTKCVRMSFTDQQHAVMDSFESGDAFMSGAIPERLGDFDRYDTN